MHFNRRFNISAAEIEGRARQRAPNWEQLLDSYLSLLMTRAKPSALRWGDKTPHQVGYIAHIQQQFPKAQFIYTYRDPRSVVTSLSNTTFANATNKPLINIEVVRQYLDLYERQKDAANTKALMEVKYENLVAEPERVVANICRFLDIEFHPSLLQKANANIRQVIGWPNDKAWGKVEPQTSQKHHMFQKHTEAYLGDRMARQGYDHQQVRFAWLLKARVFLRTLPFRLTRNIFTVFWQRKYRPFPFVRAKNPSLQNCVHWVARLTNRND